MQMRTARRISCCAVFCWAGQRPSRPGPPSSTPAVTITTVPSTTCRTHSGMLFGARTWTWGSSQSTSSASSVPTSIRCKVSECSVWIGVVIVPRCAWISCYYSLKFWVSGSSGANSTLKKPSPVAHDMFPTLLAEIQWFMPSSKLQTLQGTYNCFKVNWWGCLLV